MNKINTLIGVLLMTIVSCSSQNNYDLETVIGKKADEVIEGVSYTYLEREIVTHQPAYQIWDDMDKYRFGKINLASDALVVDTDEFSKERHITIEDCNSIRLILNSDEEKMIVGLFIHVDYMEAQAEEMIEYLIHKYNKPEVIKPEPTERKEDGILYGNSAYYWLDEQNNCSIYYYRSYSKLNKKQAIGYNVEIIQNDAILSENPDWKIIDWYKTRF